MPSCRKGYAQGLIDVPAAQRGLAQPGRLWPGRRLALSAGYRPRRFFLAASIFCFISAWREGGVAAGEAVTSGSVPSSLSCGTK